MFFLSVAFSAVCAYLVKRDAEKRCLETGKVFFWTIATFIVPLIGLVYCVFGRPKNLPRRFEAADTVENPYRRQNNRREVSVNEQICCPKCGKSVPVSFTYCPHCREQLKAEN